MHLNDSILRPNKRTFANINPYIDIVYTFFVTSPLQNCRTCGLGKVTIYDLYFNSLICPRLRLLSWLLKRLTLKVCIIKCLFSSFLPPLSFITPEVSSASSSPLKHQPGWLFVTEDNSIIVPPHGHSATMTSLRSQSRLHPASPSHSRANGLQMWLQKQEDSHTHNYRNGATC